MRLHEAQFANPPLRWMYFLSGIAVAFSIAADLFIFFGKRQSGGFRNYPIQQIPSYPDWTVAGFDLTMLAIGAAFAFAAMVAA